MIGGVLGVLVISLCRVSGRASLEEEIIILKDQVKMYEMEGNYAIDEYKDFLPDAEEMEEYLCDAHMKGYHCCCNRDASYAEAKINCMGIAKNLAKRIGKE